MEITAAAAPEGDEKPPPGVAHDVRDAPVGEHTLLHCPIRGQLNASALAKDGLTPSEEAQRIDFLKYLLKRGYPADHIAVETVVLRRLGESGRNKLRADVIVYDLPQAEAKKLEEPARLERALLVAEIKRDASRKQSGINSQLVPAMRQLPGMRVIGAYWDNVNRILFYKRLVKRKGDEVVEVAEGDLANLPPFGAAYTAKSITLDRLTDPDDLVGVLMNLANIMRSHGVNDERLRYKETVKLLLARYTDELAATETEDQRLGLQVYEGEDRGFMERLSHAYSTASRRYSRAKTLFQPVAESELQEPTLRAMVKAIQGINFSAASNESMQQVFMSFVPAVFKKTLDQYFTPVTLIETMVSMTEVGRLEKIGDPAMGTADFLVAAMAARRDDDDILQRVFGIDKDPQAYDLAVINMILNRDGQANLRCGDSIEDHALWRGEMGVVLCNPPFGSRTIETRSAVLEHYDLGHVWEQDESGDWRQTDRVAGSQQLGILFIERSYNMLADGGRLAIIVPEGYLCTPSYGYVRQWILDHFRVLSLVELPRRIFVKSDADLRSNVLVAQRLSSEGLDAARKADAPIHAELVRKVGYKLGKGFHQLIARDPATGLEIRDDDNQLVLDTDFSRVRASYARFSSEVAHEHDTSTWPGARISDVLNHPNLDMKPRRLMPKALANKAKIAGGEHRRLAEIAEVISDKIDLLAKTPPSGLYRLVEGQDIRAIEGTVLPQVPARAWVIAERKSRMVYRLRDWDIIVGLVRPERRNVGVLLDSGSDIVGAPDGVAVVRVREEWADELPQVWLFSALRSEAVRLQLWTESGGTSYGKLTSANIRNVLLPVPSADEIKAITQATRTWADGIRSSSEAWRAIGTDDDRLPILNSAIYGLEPDAE